MLAELEARATDLQESSERLSAELATSKADLEASRLALAELSTRLQSSETQAERLSSSLALAERNLADLQGLARARDVELWIWRGLDAALVVALVLK